MIRLLSILSLLLCLPLLALPLFRTPISLSLPAGLQLSAHNARLALTLWQPESNQWWESRPPNATMHVTAGTITFSTGPTITYAARLNVLWTTRSLAGLEWRAGATSKNPITQSAGVMSIPLVPYRSLSMPWFYPLPLFLILPASHLRNCLRRRYRLTHGLCPHCAYDLRASKDQCPECGSPINQDLTDPTAHSP